MKYKISIKLITHWRLHSNFRTKLHQFGNIRSVRLENAPHKFPMLADGSKSAVCIHIHSFSKRHHCFRRLNRFIFIQSLWTILDIAEGLSRVRKVWWAQKITYLAGNLDFFRKIRIFSDFWRTKSEKITKSEKYFFLDF